MEGTQLLNYVPLEPQGPAVPQIPRPKGLFDHLCFANATGMIVTNVHVELTGANASAVDIAQVAAQSVSVVTRNFDNGQINYVRIEFDVAGAGHFTLPTFSVHEINTWHLGRAMVGVTAAVDGSGVVPYCVLTLFPDDMSNKIYVQAVPHDAWA